MAKVEWIRKGDSNSSYFYATLKSKQTQICIGKLIKENGEICDTQEEIEMEVVEFYKNLMGTAHSNLQGVDIISLRKGAISQSRNRKHLQWSN